MKVTESLPNDGAPFYCGRKQRAPGPRENYCCGDRAVRLLTVEAYEELKDIFSFRAVCAQHATEAEMELET